MRAISGNKGRRSARLAFTVLMGLFLAESTSFADTVNLQWPANPEADIVGYKVYYKADSSQLPFDGAGAVEGVAPIDVANKTTATITGLDPGKDYYFAVTAYNSAGLEGPYSSVIGFQGVKDTNPPVLALTSPMAGATVSGNVLIAATASDDIGVAKVEYYEGENLLAASNVSPYSYSWNTLSLSNGQHALTARAYDAAGNVTNVAVNINVLNDTSAPTVAIVSPSVAGGAVAVSATASDDVAVTRVEFYLNDALQATSTSAPYSFTWNTSALANGTYTLSAKAYDAAGNVGQSSGATVSVLNDTTAPTVSFLAPASNYVYSNKVSISASATDDVGVTKMELYVDNALKYSTTGSSFNTATNMSVGVHTITVKAYDAANNVKVASKTVSRFN